MTKKPEKPAQKINKLDFVDKVTHSECHKKKLLKRGLRDSILYAQVIILALSLLVTYKVVELSFSLPDVNFLKEMEPEQTSQIFDVNDKLVAEIIADEDRIYVPLKDISPYFLNAVIAMEDLRFYDHNGVDMRGTVRALVNNVAGASSVQGGSTITQQLAKNWYLVPEKSFKRKFLEAMLSTRIENNFTKEQILEKYVNIIYLGNRSYGIERAAKRFFDKTAKDLNLAESALLAGLIRAPERYSPYVSERKAKERQRLVLDRMYEFGYITDLQRQEALITSMKYEPSVYSYSKYPYFIDHVLYILRRNYGESVVKKGGLKIYTTLDPTAQQIAEKTVKEGVKAQGAYSMVKQGALVSIDVKTGYIKALVGGVDFQKSQFNRATLAKRATGSGFKPIVYLTGLRLGLITPDSIIYDAPIAYRTKWNVWCPHNWDGRYMGKMTVRKALTLSRNTPTVRVALMSGLDNVIRTARLLGIRSHMDRGYSIVLGSAGITPIEIATMYTTLARDGVFLEPTVIRCIVDSKGNVLEDTKREPVRVVDSKYVRMLNSILVDVVEKGTGKNARLDGREIAGKTGTTDEFKDVWFTGFTPDTVTTIWMGNDENQTLRGVWSSNCATLWKNYSSMYYAYNNIIAEPFKNIDDKEEVIIAGGEDSGEEGPSIPQEALRPTIAGSDGNAIEKEGEEMAAEAAERAAAKPPKPLYSDGKPAQNEDSAPQRAASASQAQQQKAPKNQYTQQAATQPQRQYGQRTGAAAQQHQQYNQGYNQGYYNNQYGYNNGYSGGYNGYNNYNNGYYNNYPTQQAYNQNYGQNYSQPAQTQTQTQTQTYSRPTQTYSQMVKAGTAKKYDQAARQGYNQGYNQGYSGYNGYNGYYGR